MPCWLVFDHHLLQWMYVWFVFFLVGLWRIFVWNSVSNKEKLLQRLFSYHSRPVRNIVWAICNVMRSMCVSNLEEQPPKMIPNLDDLIMIILRNFGKAWDNSDSLTHLLSRFDWNAKIHSEGHQFQMMKENVPQDLYAFL